MIFKLLKNYRGDIFGGITAGIIALPLGLAFGVASGLGAITGVYTAIFVGLFASLFGGTPTQISGPTGPMTVVVASFVALHPGNVNIIFMSIFLAGIIQIIFSLLKVGKYINYVPYPVISGFMSGIGAIIIILQINPFIGLKSAGTTIDAVKLFISSLNEISFSSLLLGLVCVLVVFLTPKNISRKVPPVLLALVIGTFLSVIFDMNVATIGDIPTTLPKIHLSWISLEEFRIILPIGITLAMLGSIDSLLTSLVADSLTKTKHNSDKELLGQGIGNMAASIFGGLPGAGATMRTVANIKTGGKTKLSGVIFKNNKKGAKRRLNSNAYCFLHYRI